MTPLETFLARPFTPSMALQQGITRDRLRWLLRTGEVRKVLYGVYVAAHVGDGVWLRARAAALVLPEHCVVADRCAAWLHGIDLLDLVELDVVPRLEAVSVGGNQATHRSGLFGGKRDLRRSEITVVEGVAVTTPIRTACDVACLRGRYRALAALDAFRREFAISDADLVGILPRYVKRRGCVQLRELVALSTDRADSQMESWVRLMMHDEGLPPPAAQVWVELPDWGRVRVENAYEHLRIGVEYDGEEFHTSEDDREHDRLRREALARAGWLIVVVRKEDLSAAARAVWLRRVAAAVAERTPERPSKRVYSRGPDHPSYRRVRVRHPQS